jgi:hypothetical protein
MQLNYLTKPLNQNKMEEKTLGTEWLVEQLRNGKELNDELINEAKKIEENNLLVPLKVEIKDYEKDINYLLMSFQSVGISINYVTADLVNECFKLVQSKGGDANIEDMVNVKNNHIKKWEEYFKNKKLNDQEEK